MEWLKDLSQPETALLTVIATLVIGGLGKHFLLPACRWLAKRAYAVAYPVLSGSIVLDRIVALPNYVEAVKRQVSRLRNPWLEEGQVLKDILVPVSLKETPDVSGRVQLADLFRQRRTVVLIGEPGSGKSTGLKAIALDCIYRRLNSRVGNRLVPVFIELRRMSLAGDSLNDYVLSVFRQNRVPHPRRLQRKLRQNGQLVFLLDGLDEVSDVVAGQDDDVLTRGEVIGEIRKLLEEEDRENGCQVYLTSRPVGYQDQLRDCIEETAEVAEFHFAEIRSFIGNWEFRLPKSRGDLLESLAQRPRLLDICKNPLMLTIVASLYKETDYVLPDSREEFYRVCIDALIRRWDASKDLRNRFPPALKAAFLQQFSFETLESGRLEITESKIHERISHFLKDRHDVGTTDAELFFQELLRSGIIGRLPTGEVYFAHKTLAESLAAAFLRNRTGQLAELWENDPRVWLEVCSLLVADPQTPESDIIKLVDAAIRRDDWNSALVLAGEANTRWQSKSAELCAHLKRQECWHNLDRRAIAALARLGDESRPILERMVVYSVPEVRQRAIYAIGLLREDWGIELIIRSLATSDGTQASVDAVAGLGEDAVPLLHEVLHSGKWAPELSLACVSVLEAIGSVAAADLVISISLHSTAAVKFHAIRSVMRMLRLQEFREEFDSHEFESLAGRDVDKTRAWIVPETAAENHTAGVAYSYLVQEFSARTNELWRELVELRRKLEPLAVRWRADADEREELEELLESLEEIWAEQVETINELPSVVLVPTLIESQTAIPIEVFSGDRGRGEFVMSVLLDQQKSVNRGLWSRVASATPNDVQFSGRGPFSAFCLLVAVLYLGPTVVASVLGLTSLAWFSVTFVVGGVAVLIATFDQDGTPIYGWLILTTSPLASLRRVIRDRTIRPVQRACSLGIVVSYTAPLVLATVVQAIVISPVFALSLIPPVLSWGYEYDASSNRPYVTVLKRSNPLKDVQDRLDSGGPLFSRAV